jgi:hypothetical protein
MFFCLLGMLLILFALQDSFEALVLPRRVTRQWRVSRLYYRNAWRAWRRGAQLIPSARYRESALSVFGPLSLLGLFACWAAMLIIGFALVHWGNGSLGNSPTIDLGRCLYMSGETFFTLGYGDVTPGTMTGKMLAVMEAGMGFGFMAIVIGYLPVLYQAFSRREQTISLLDGRAGSPPTAGELLRRSEAPEDCTEVDRFLAVWELWAADLLESHLSYPVLSYYRSQHGNHSWLAALAVVLDSSSLILTFGGPRSHRRAQLAFAMARHACVDICLVFWLPPVEPRLERLRNDEYELFTHLAEGAAANDNARRQLSRLRALYEPFLQSLADYFELHLPRFFPDVAKADNWQTSAWTEKAPGITELPRAARGEAQWE